jgi:hypothetical protein
MDLVAMLLFAIFPIGGWQPQGETFPARHLLFVMVNRVDHVCR